MEKEKELPKLELTQVFAKKVSTEKMPKSPRNWKAVFTDFSDSIFPNIENLSYKFLKFSGIVALGSYSLNLGKLISYEQQLELVNNPNFSPVCMMMFGIICAAHILKGIFDISSDDKPMPNTISIFAPVQTALVASFMVPCGDNGLSAFSAITTSVIHLAQQIPF